jgi:hypothetical protein
MGVCPSPYSPRDYAYVASPNYPQRTAIFKPLGLELTRQMEAVMGTTTEKAEPVDLPPRPPETQEVMESKLIPCERCGIVVAMRARDIVDFRKSASRFKMDPTSP